MTETKVRELRPGIHVVHLPLPMRPTIVNVYLIDGGDEWALVDTGINTAESLAAFESALRQLGCEPARIAKIICTHHHPDHYGASRPLKELTGAAVHIHPLEFTSSQIYDPHDRSEEARVFFRLIGLPVERFAHIPSPHEFWSGLYKTVPPDRHLNDGEILRVGTREVEVVWTPGHAPGHCVLYLPRDRVMIAGDHLLPKITPHVGWSPNGPPDPLGDFLDSQRKILRFAVDVVMPAHGGPFGDHRHRANQIIQHHRYRMQEMWDFIRARPATAYEVAAKAFGFDKDSSLMVQFPATFETLAHLQHMVHTGRVDCEMKDGTLLYRGK